MHRLVKSLALALCVGTLALLSPCPVRAGTLNVEVVDQGGNPVEDAVVTATPTSGKWPQGPRGHAIIDQIHRRFVPLVSVIQTGTLVNFPNKDNIEHDVYSFSPAKTFELPLYSGIPAKPVLFDKPGLVVLGCNIHDQMIAYVQVVDTPYFGKTDAQGKLSLANLPADSYDVTAWSYRLEEGEPQAHSTERVDGTTSVRFALKLKPS